MLNGDTLRRLCGFGGFLESVDRPLLDFAAET